jgi:hypothetical protein
MQENKTPPEEKIQKVEEIIMAPSEELPLEDETDKNHSLRSTRRAPGKGYKKRRQGRSEREGIGRG